MYKEYLNYKDNIKPAPLPHYLLEKFGGDLEINEFRIFNRKTKIFLTKKPITNITPELHIESNTNFPSLENINEISEETLILKRKHTAKTHFFF